jgi:hypothetical protein
MKRRKPLPIPQHEFGFAPDAFNLIQETGLDGDRISRERSEAEAARAQAEGAQSRLFSEFAGQKSAVHCQQKCQQKCSESVSSGSASVSLCSQ